MEGGCVVLDMGSGSIKAEFAGSENPKIFQNSVGHVKHLASIPQQQLDGLIDHSFFVSDNVTKHRGLLKVSYPMTNGHVTDWSSLGHIFSHVDSALGMDPKDHPLLISEAALSSRPQRAKLGQLLFEQLQHPSILFSVQALLSLYSTGNTTGVVLDVGDGVTQVCPVYRGYSIRDAIRRVDFGGRDVTQHLHTVLRQYSGINLDTSAEFEILRQIKEQRCSVASSAIKSDVENAGTGNSSNGILAAVPKIKHKLPDGSDISIGSEQVIAPEVLFNPALMGRECPGVVQVLNESIRRTDIDLRRHLYENVFLAGGCTLFNNFGSRFLAEVTRKTPRDCKVRVTAPAERMITTWIGGSFLAQLSTFKAMAVKKSEYLEEGERIIHSKLFC
eukprot:Tbor_TRINITY_DN4959_c0_g1::TRINITY_DN4959_c0_g1_i1::g.9972::m.9972/K16575/ACTR1, ARP1; centractin